MMQSYTKTVPTDMDIILKNSPTRSGLKKMQGSENMTTEYDIRKDVQESAILADRLPGLNEEDMRRRSS